MTGVATDPAGVVLTKRCPYCGDRLPLTQFHKNKNNADGRRGECKRCSTAQVQERRRQLRLEMGDEAYLELMRERTRRSRQNPKVAQRGRDATKARQRAMERLCAQFPERFQQLLREERAGLGLPSKWERP